MNLASKIVGLFGFWAISLGVFLTSGVGIYTLWSMATHQPSFIIKEAVIASPSPVLTPIRYVPEVFYLTPSHNNFPGTIEAKSPEDTRFAVTGVGEIFELKLISQANQQVVYQRRFAFDRPIQREVMFCLFGFEYSTSHCAGVPEKDWKEGNYIFEVVASYTSGGSNSNQRLIHFNRWPGR